MKIKYKDLSNILLIDIETAPESQKYTELSEIEKDLWNHKANILSSRQGITLEKPEEINAFYFQKAGIFAEFSKVICISVGLMIPKKRSYKLRLKSFYGHDEVKILTDFADLMNAHFNKASKHYICGHNIREFDIPFICRRMLKHQIPFPKLLNLSGLKPWETNFILDTMQLWKFGDYKNFTSLKLLAHVLGIPSPKNDLDGSKVAEVYWEENDLERIVKYCEGDVMTVAEVMGKFYRLPPLEKPEEE